jgi:hypothetical protein
LKLAKSKYLTIVVLIPVLAIGFGIVLVQGLTQVGLITGNHIKYGNAVVSGPLGANLDFDWLEYNVSMVSGTNVTIIQTGVFKNGTAIPNNGNSTVFNLEKSTMNGLLIQGGPLIPANLNQGDRIGLTMYNVTRTESRTYLGQSRIVNILETSSSSTNSTLRATFVYDRTSGIVLEQNIEQTDTSGTSSMSNSVTETNIFTGETIPEFPTFIATAVLMSTIVTVAIIYRIKQTK